MMMIIYFERYDSVISQDVSALLLRSSPWLPSRRTTESLDVVVIYVKQKKREELTFFVPSISRRFEYERFIMKYNKFHDEK